MPSFYQRKHCIDGSINPEWKPDTRKRIDTRARKRSGGANTKWALGKFVAWDSEGLDIGGRHESVCLLNSEREQLISYGGIRTVDALEFMCDSLARHAKAIHVGFVFSYDVNMLLRDVPRERVSELWKLGKCYYRTDRCSYLLRYRPRKEFSVRRFVRGAETGVGGVIWDVFGFFQSSFVKALESFHANPKVIARIHAMKARRAKFTLTEMTEILAYCAEECGELVDMMEKLHGYMQGAELSVARWDGAAAIAASLLKRESVKPRIGSLPESVERAARHAYFGGRIELLHYGHNPARKVYEADIRSAYPAAIRRLPCLSCGVWEMGAGDIPGDGRTFCLALVSWSLPAHTPLCPFPWRSASDGNVYFPPRGMGWYWLPELDAARRCGFPFKAHEWWQYKTNCVHEPFAFVPELYEQRAAWKRAGNGAEKVLKLGLNSLYGKLAQRVGIDPPYHQIAWAGWITSETRARMLTVAVDALQRGRVFMIATDAIYADVPLNVTSSETLGDWETHEATGATFVQSGVYWTGPIEAADKSKIRGFDTDSLDRRGVIANWRNGAASYGARLTRFVGMGKALTGPKQWRKWRTWTSEVKELSLTPQGKREYVQDSAGRRLFGNGKPWREFVPTQATDPVHERERQGWLSAPTDPPLRSAGGIQNAIITEHECLEVYSPL